MLLRFLLVLVVSSIGLGYSTSLAKAKDQTITLNYTYDVINSVAIPELPDEYKGYSWHRYLTNNFEVLAIDNNHAKAIVEVIEDVKKWTQVRWGMPSVDYDKPCMIMCVPSKSLLQKWFRKTEINPKRSKSERVDGKYLDVYSFFISADDNYLSDQLPSKIGWVNLMHYEHLNNVSLRPWAFSGMSLLNSDINSIKTNFINLPPKGSLIPVKELFEASPNSVNDPIFCKQSAAMCLLLMKQGNTNQRFINFVKQSSKDKPSVSLASLYGFRSYEHFDEVYVKYCNNLTHDIGRNLTPDMGLTWFLPINIGN